MGYPQPAAPLPPRIQAIVRPGTSPWAVALAPTTATDVTRRTVTAVTLATMPMLVGFALLALGGVGTAIGLVLIASSIGVTGGLILLGVRVGRRHVVSAPNYAYEGAPIEGAALDVLADIQQRFRWAERMVGEVPTGIRWDEVDHQVDVLLWEAAGHAAKVSALDAELRNLGYAEDGTPAAALRRQLQRQRDTLWGRLEDTQYEADDLAREASNAAAAARIALARSGSVHELVLHTPSGADLVARGTLAAARARLALLAEVWAELDETSSIAAERLELDPAPARRRLPPPSEGST